MEKRGVLEFGGIKKEALGLRVCVEQRGKPLYQSGFRVHGDRVEDLQFSGSSQGELGKWIPIVLQKAS